MHKSCVLIFWLTVYIECNCYGCISISDVTKNYIIQPTQTNLTLFLLFFNDVYTGVNNWIFSRLEHVQVGLQGGERNRETGDLFGI